MMRRTVLTSMIIAMFTFTGAALSAGGGGPGGGGGMGGMGGGPSGPSRSFGSDWSRQQDRDQDREQYRDPDVVKDAQKQKQKQKEFGAGESEMLRERIRTHQE
jgi:hypothetical protein